MDMGQIKGQTGNPGGRPLGSPNQVTKEMREAVMLLTKAEIPRLQEMLNKVSIQDPARYVSLMIRLIALIMPRPLEIISDEAEEPIQIVFARRLAVNQESAAV